jgi:hypothetical protein
MHKYDTSIGVVFVFGRRSEYKRRRLFFLVLAAIKCTRYRVTAGLMDNRLNILAQRTNLFYAKSSCAVVPVKQL